MKAIVAKEGRAVLITDRPLPSLREDYLLVKVHAIALNPTDWKHAELTKVPDVLLGCDYAGTVEEVGTKVKKPFKKGDRVMGFVHGGNSAQPQDGAFAEYIVVKGDIQAHIPKSMSFEEAATFGVGITTVGQGLYQVLGLPLPRDEPLPPQHRGKILIYGGSTATGVLGLQFARLSGYAPITTCSPHNFDLVSQYGAEETFDYGDDDAAGDINDSTGGEIKLAWDTVSTAWTAKFCASAISPTSSKLATLHPIRLPDAGIETFCTMAYTIFGEPWQAGDNKYPAVPEDFEFGKMWWDTAERLIEEGKIKPAKIDLGKGGLQGALEGLDRLRDAKISGRKLIYRISDTP